MPSLQNHHHENSVQAHRNRRGADSPPPFLRWVHTSHRTDAHNISPVCRMNNIELLGKTIITAHTTKKIFSRILILCLRGWIQNMSTLVNTVDGRRQYLFKEVIALVCLRKLILRGKHLKTTSSENSLFFGGGHFKVSAS